MPHGLPSQYPYAMQQPAQEQQPTIEMSLREHLLAAGAGQPQVPVPVTPSSQIHQAHSASPHSHAIDPAIAGPGYTMSAGDSGGDGHMSEGRKGRRELSTSKRAAQNRAAQRAFRQRKEEYIKQLKDQVKEFEQLCEMYKNLQTENYQLRDYIINLQSRLLETQGEIPPAPANIDLSRPHGEPSSQQQGEQQQSSSAGLSEREIGELRMAAAQAAAAARQQEHHGSDMNNGGKHHHEEAAYLPSEYPEKRQKVDDTPASSGSQAPSTGDIGASPQNGV